MQVRTVIGEDANITHVEAATTVLVASDIEFLNSAECGARRYCGEIYYLSNENRDKNIFYNAECEYEKKAMFWF